MKCIQVQYHCLQGNAVSDNRTPNFSIRVPVELRGDLERFAKEDHRTLANLIVAVLQDYVRQRKEKKKG
jgi:hypothetical protein